MTAVRLDALTRDDIESSERDLHRVGSDLPHPSAVFDVLNGNINVPVGNDGVEASARVMEGIGWCATRRGAMRQSAAARAFHPPFTMT